MRTRCTQQALKAFVRKGCKTALYCAAQCGTELHMCSYNIVARTFIATLLMPSKWPKRLDAVWPSVVIRKRQRACWDMGMYDRCEGGTERVLTGESTTL